LNVRKIIAERLYYELDRRDIPLIDIANKAKIDKRKLEKYLDGSTEVKIAEVMSICCYIPKYFESNPAIFFTLN
jgi:hypothetical protein